MSFWRLTVLFGGVLGHSLTVEELVSSVPQACVWD